MLRVTAAKKCYYVLALGFLGIGGVFMAGLVRLAHPCRSCERDGLCSVGRRAHCVHFCRYVQALCLIRGHQRLTRDLGCMLARREVRPQLI